MLFGAGVGAGVTYFLGILEKKDGTLLSTSAYLGGAGNARDCLKGFFLYNEKEKTKIIRRPLGRHHKLFCRVNGGDLIK